MFDSPLAAGLLLLVAAAASAQNAERKETPATPPAERPAVAQVLEVSAAAPVKILPVVETAEQN